MMLRNPLIVLAASALLAGALVLPAAADDLQTCRDSRANPVDAAAACSRAIQSGTLSESDLVATYNFLGLFLAAAGDAEGAVAAHSEVIKRNPRDHDALHWRARMLALLGQHDRADADWSEAIRIINDSKPPDLYLRGVYYSARGDFDRAIADFDAAKRASASIYIERAYAHLFKGELNKAHAQATAGLKADPKNGEAFALRARVYELAGQVDDALTDLNAAVCINPPDDPLAPDTYAYRGRIYERKGDLARAQSDYAQALKLNPFVAYTYDTWAIGFEHAGRLDWAIYEHEWALKLDPNRQISIAARDRLRAAIAAKQPQSPPAQPR
jgi:tetratricopeptide (TPR) repeat protein